MTAPNGAILFNSSTGSDTTASGLGSANVYGSGASTTGSSAVVTGIDTTGVSSGDLLWVQSSSGRQFSIIATVDSSTQVTCDDTFANTESGRTWAIGGKRATFDNADSRKVFADGKAGWVVETETDQTINSPIAVTVNITSGMNYFTIRGDISAKRVITQTADNYGFNLNGADLIRFENLDLQNTSATKNNNLNWAWRGVNGTYILSNCSAKDQTNNWYRGVSNNGAGQTCMIDCEFANCVESGADHYGHYVHAVRCYSHDNGNAGFRCGGSRHSEYVNCIADSNSGNGFQCQGSYEKITGCISRNNGSSGISIGSIRSSVNGCVLSENGAYGLSAGSSEMILWDGNCYYGNTTGETDITNSRPNDITLTADPFVDPTASPPDFNLNGTAGAGATLRASNFAINTGTSVYPFRQYVSDDFDSGAGGGGATVHPLYAN